jgi:hypothetical protein
MMLISAPKLQFSGYRYSSHITNTYLQRLTVTNGGAALNGPLSVTQCAVPGRIALRAAE